MSTAAPGAELSRAPRLCVVPQIQWPWVVPALGAVATESAIRDAAMAGGFTQFRRATETPFNRIFEARK